MKYQPTGKGIRYGDPPISCKFPRDIAARLRAMPNRSDFIRAAVVAALEKLDANNDSLPTEKR